MLVTGVAGAHGYCMLVAMFLHTNKHSKTVSAAL